MNTPAPAFRIRNWRHFQHYSHRNPPWIKLHFALLSSEDWVTLDDASRVLAVACMLIASKNEGEFPANKEYLSRVAYLNNSPDFSPLVKCGFLIPCDGVLADASALQASACSESDRDTDRNTDTEKKRANSDESADVAPATRFNEQSREMARLLGELMLDNDPKAKIPATESAINRWFDAIDKINRIDGRGWAEIEDVIRWCQQDDFWKSNILSGGALRKQFPKLRLTMSRRDGKRESVTEHNLRVLREREGRVK